ncbi:MAG: BMP family lipoprotein [Candidatus Hodarchaeales archaeon]|jgi:basic membrane protein A
MVQCGIPKVNNIYRILILSIFLIHLIPFVQLTRASTSDELLEFAVIYSYGIDDPLQDYWYNRELWEGIDEFFFMGEFHYGVNITSFIPWTNQEVLQIMNDLPSSGKYDLIICAGPVQADLLLEVADNFPDQDWVIIDAIVNKFNVESFTYKEQEGAFLAGALAAMYTRTKKVVFLGGDDSYTINKYKYAFEQGITYIDDNITLTSVLSPNPNNPWNDTQGGEELGHNLFFSGHDIIFTVAGKTNEGVMRSAGNFDDAVVIGSNFIYEYFFGDDVLCSMVKKYSTAVITSINEKREDTWSAGHVELGVTEDTYKSYSGLELSSYGSSKIYNLSGIRKEPRQHIRDVRKLISDGSLIIDDDSPIFILKVPSRISTPGLFLTILCLLCLRSSEKLKVQRILRD